MTEEPNQQPEQSGDQSAPRLYDLGAALVESSRGSIYCLTIIGQVEGHSLAPNNTKTTKYEHVLPLLAHLEQSEEVDGVLLLLNTVGGDIEAGLAIAEMVAGMTKPTVTLVLGGGHSIGIPLAVSGRQTFIVPSASMTVHPVRMSGLMIAAPQSYRYFERVQESIVSFVARHSRITQDDFRQLMLADGDMSNDVGTILYGSQAVQLGLIDRLGTLSDALEALYGMIGKNGCFCRGPVLYCVQIYGIAGGYGMNTNFKTALFGGFDREDVVSYIQQTSRENQQRVSALEEENHGLQERNRAMEAELNTLRRAVLENSAAADTCLQLQTQLRELQEQAQKLQKETEYLRAQAAEYQSLKDHIADIEISAHRRTEEFRAKAIEQLRQLTRQQETWCAQSRAKYAELNRQFCQKLALAQQTLAEPDLSGFQEMEAGLRQLEESFSETNQA